MHKTPEFTIWWRLYITQFYHKMPYRQVTRAPEDRLQLFLSIYLRSGMTLSKHRAENLSQCLQRQSVYPGMCTL